MKRRIRAFGRDNRGGALVEFALVLPFMIVLLFFAVELVEAMEAHQRLQHVAFAVADVVAQDKTTDGAELAGVISGGQLMMAPLPSTSLVQQVASVSADANGNISQDWVYPAGSGSLASLVPSGFLKANESVIVSNATYDYAPATHLFVSPSFTFRQKAFLRPRFTTKVAYKP